MLACVAAFVVIAARFLAEDAIRILLLVRMEDGPALHSAALSMVVRNYACLCRLDAVATDDLLDLSRVVGSGVFRVCNQHDVGVRCLLRLGHRFVEITANSRGINSGFTLRAGAVHDKTGITVRSSGLSNRVEVVGGHISPALRSYRPVRLVQIQTACRTRVLLLPACRALVHGQSLRAAACYCGIVAF